MSIREQGRLNKRGELNGFAKKASKNFAKKASKKGISQGPCRRATTVALQSSQQPTVEGSHRDAFP